MNIGTPLLNRRSDFVSRQWMNQRSEFLKTPIESAQIRARSPRSNAPRAILFPGQPAIQVDESCQKNKLLQVSKAEDAGDARRNSCRRNFTLRTANVQNLSFLREFFQDQEEEPRISRMDTDQEEKNSHAEALGTRRLEASPIRFSSRISPRPQRLCVSLFFQPFRGFGMLFSVRSYPCPSVKSVVEFLWLRPTAAP